MKHNRINNSQMSECTTKREPFTNNNISAYATRHGNLYAVYSWGGHYPMYVYDYVADEWFGNSDKSTRSTERHKTQARPDTNKPITYRPTEYLQNIIAMGGYVQTVAERIHNIGDAA